MSGTEELWEIPEEWLVSCAHLFGVVKSIPEALLSLSLVGGGAG